MKKIVSKLVQKALTDLKINIGEKNIEKFIEIPPSIDMGDYAMPCFFLAKELNQSPIEIAKKIKTKLKKLPEEFTNIEVSGPYVNFFVNRKKLAEKIIKEILSKKDNYGKNNLGKRKKTMIEFSQPNTHKAFHVGHIRGTSIGESISRISEFCSEKVIRANYSGDTGMHIAKWIWCYNKYHSNEKLKEDEEWIASIYVEAVKKLVENEEFQKEVEIINKKIEEKSDKKINDLWKKTRKLSIDSWDKIYSELNTKFDVHYFESKFEKTGKEIAKKLLKKKIAKYSEGAVIMDLEKYKLGVWILLRKDGTILYSAKDLALAEKKLKDFKIDTSIIVSGNEQDLHFRQLFKTLELMKFKNYDKFKNISFGMVRLPTGKMSSRTGDNILYSDFMKEVTSYAKKRIIERFSQIEKKELEKRSLKITIAAIKYSMLKQNTNKSIIFRKEDALNFEGNTGAYLQYSYARASSILRKIKIKRNKINITKLELKEIELIKKLDGFKEVVQSSYKNLNPSIIANYSYELAQIFNEFYHECPVIGSEKENFRISLVVAFRQVLKNSLNLLGIEVIEKM